MLTDNERRAGIIRQGRAAVRLVEAANVLLENCGSWREAWLLKTVRALYQHRLRQIVGYLPPDVAAEVLAASDAMTSTPIHDPSRN